MARLTKDQAARHREALALVNLERTLTWPERQFVLDNLQEAETPTHGLDGAYFTPAGLARDLCAHVNGFNRDGRVIDLCAGIGRLAFHCDLNHRAGWGTPLDLVCVERNPDYVKAGRKILPDATWIEGDIFDLPGMDPSGRFDFAISNPPFGRTDRAGLKAPRYRGGRFEYHVIDIAAGLANYGVFIVPQNSAPFRYSGEPRYREERDDECRRFETVTGITLEPNAGVDTTYYRHHWRGVTPKVEIVQADFTETRPPAPRRPAEPAEPVTSLQTADDRHTETVNRLRANAGQPPLTLFDVLDLNK